MRDISGAWLVGEEDRNACLEATVSKSSHRHRVRRRVRRSKFPQCNFCDWSRLSPLLQERWAALEGLGVRTMTNCERCGRPAMVLFLRLMNEPGSAATTNYVEMYVCGRCWWYGKSCGPERKQMRSTP